MQLLQLFFSPDLLLRGLQHSYSAILERYLHPYSVILAQNFFSETKLRNDDGGPSYC